jgi:hypothetical protein
MNIPKRELDKRYKKGVDTGAMSFHNVELPLMGYTALNKPVSVTPNPDKQNRRKVSDEATKRYKRDMKLKSRKAKLKNQ